MPTTELMVTVQVISRETCEPLMAKDVAIQVRHGHSDRQLTNANGEVYFPTLDPCEYGTIYINDSSVYQGRILGFNCLLI